MTAFMETRKPNAPAPAAGSVEQIGAYLGIGRTGVFALIKGGRLPVAKIGRRTLIRYADADQLLQRSVRADVFG